jgi:hypothetical protein
MVRKRTNFVLMNKEPIREMFYCNSWFVDYLNCKNSDNISYFSNFGPPTVVIADMRA